MTTTDKFKTLIGNVPNGDILNHHENVSNISPSIDTGFCNANLVITLAKLQVAFEMVTVIPAFASYNDFNTYCHE